jgi:hypothetical protein
VVMSRIDGCIIAHDVGIGVLSSIRETVGVYKYTGVTTFRLVVW